MPLINDKKYSCEPCIRGHRATSCQHTDRMLIEVRKPGRPMQSCGHHLATCVCGRLPRAFSGIEDSTTTQRPTLVTTRTVVKKTPSGVKKVSARLRRSSSLQYQEKLGRTTASASLRISTPTPTNGAILDGCVDVQGGTSKADPRVSNNGLSDSTHTTASVPNSPSSISSPPVIPEHSKTQAPTMFSPAINTSPKYPPHITNPSSRIEDLSIFSHSRDLNNSRNHIRAQYIMASSQQHDKWRAVHWQEEI